MLLSKSILSFPLVEGAPSVTLSVPGTEFKLVSVLGKEAGTFVVQSQVYPERYQEGNLPEEDELPAELEMLVAQSEAMLGSLRHYLVCDEHRALCRVELGTIHEKLEQAKQALPYISELSLETILTAATTGMPTGVVTMLGLARDQVKGPLSDLERGLMEEMNTEEGPKKLTALADAVVLDFECVQPPLTDAEREMYRVGLEASHAKPAVHSEGVHHMPAPGVLQ